MKNDIKCEIVIDGSSSVHWFIELTDHDGANYQLRLIAYSNNSYSATISFLEGASVEMLAKIELYYSLRGAYWKKSPAEGAAKTIEKRLQWGGDKSL